MKSVRIQSCSGPHFLAFGLNTERYEVYLRIQSECGKKQTKEICRYPWILEEAICSPRLLFVQKDNLKRLCSAENY